VYDETNSQINGNPVALDLSSSERLVQEAMRSGIVMTLPTDLLGSWLSLRCLSTRRKSSAGFKGSKSTGAIILSESNEDFLKFLATSLTDAGFTVYPAVNAQQALQISREYTGEIDLLVSDAQLLTGDESSPNKTGIELARQFHAKRPPSKVLLMSEFNIETLVRSEGWGFIHKPFAIDALKQKIESLLGESSSVGN
jgi:CheY-like chemotaxis protein